MIDTTKTELGLKKCKCQNWFDGNSSANEPPLNRKIKVFVDWQNDRGSTTMKDIFADLDSAGN